MSLKYICQVDELIDGAPKLFKVDGHSLALVKIEGEKSSEIFAIDDTCSHQNYSLSEGLVDKFERCIECPRHGATFSLINGEPLSLPATKRVKVYKVVKENSKLFVEIG